MKSGCGPGVHFAARAAEAPVTRKRLQQRHTEGFLSQGIVEDARLILSVRHSLQYKPADGIARRFAFFLLADGDRSKRDRQDEGPGLSLGILHLDQG